MSMAPNEYSETKRSPSRLHKKSGGLGLGVSLVVPAITLGARA